MLDESLGVAKIGLRFLPLKYRCRHMSQFRINRPIDWAANCQTFPAVETARKLNPLIRSMDYQIVSSGEAPSWLGVFTESWL